MNKAELISAVAGKSELTKKDAEKAVNSMISVITETLGEGEKVQLVGFGTFEVRDRAERKGRNPQTKEEIIKKIISKIYINEEFEIRIEYTFEEE